MGSQPRKMIAFEQNPELFSFASLHQHYLLCRRHKRNTFNALRFEARQELNLLELSAALQDRSYRPSASVCFVTERPKLREIFAADFRDRVVHHVLVHELERYWEPVFIHDSYACRKDKGIHKAVDRLRPSSFGAHPATAGGEPTICNWMCAITSCASISTCCGLY